MDYANDDVVGAFQRLNKKQIVEENLIPVENEEWKNFYESLFE